MMMLVDQRVCHKSFGTGTIIKQSDKTIEVHFDSAPENEIKKFIYPECFEKFLCFEDDELQSRMNDQLKIHLEEQDAKEKAEADEFMQLQEAKKKAFGTYHKVKKENTSKRDNLIVRKEGIVKDHAGNIVKGLHYAQKISIDDDYWFDRSADVLNECFGKAYEGWQKGGCYINDTHTEFVWFPKMAVTEYGIETAQSTNKAWINVLSDDGKEIRMYNHENLANDNGNPANPIHHTFAKFPNQPYKYIGSFIRDFSRSTPNDVYFVRVAETVDIIPWFKDEGTATDKNPVQ